MYSTNLKALKFPVTLALALALLAAMLLIPPALAQRPGTAFSYQGSLSDGGSPVDDTCAFEFKLYDAETGGTQIGSTQTANTVTVSDGLFTVNLDFGVDAFTGPPRYLEIAVQCTGDGAYTTLSPRQPLHPTPYAMYATEAGAVAWSDVSGKPTNLATISDTISGLTCTDGQVAKWNNTASQWECAADSGGASYTAGAGIEIVDEVISSTLTAGTGLIMTNNVISSTVPQPQNVIWVAKSGGDYTSIQAALDSISDNSATNPYLVMVAPGVYTEQVTMKEYVDIQGAGEGTTIIQYTGSNTGPWTDSSSATVIGVDNAELRLLTVQSDGSSGSDFTVAILNSSGSTSLLHVTASAAGGSTNYGVYNDPSSSPTMDNVTVSASGDGVSQNRAVLNGSSSPIIRNSALSASGGSLSWSIWGAAKVANSMLVGSLEGSGFRCVGVYDGNFDTLTCP